MGRVGGREMQEGREMGTYCICITDSLCYKAETNTTMESNYTPIKMLKNKLEKHMPLIWPFLSAPHLLVIIVLLGIQNTNPKSKQRSMYSFQCIGPIL